MAQIRQEINIHNSNFLCSNPLGTSNATIQLDTTQYNGTATYYFEIVGQGSGTNVSTITLRRKGTSTDDASINTATSTTPALTRSVAFTPPAGQTEYVITGFNVNGTGRCKVSRIVIIQNATTLTNTETQIEICGAGDSTTTSTTAVPVAYSKYWKYTAANWDGTKTFYFESTDKAGNTKSGVTVVLQTSTDILAPSWSDVASSSHTNTSLSATRTRSSAITLVDGNWYRVAYSTGTSKSAATIYNAKIIVQQVEGGFLPSGLNSLQIVGGASVSGARAQSFTVTNTSTLTAVKLQLKKTGSPTDTLQLDIVTSLGGSSLGSATISCSSLTASLALYTLTLSGSVSLSIGTTYYLQLTRSPDSLDGTNSPDVGQTNAGGDGYPNGSMFTRASGTWNGGGGSDLYFELVGITGITKLEPQYLLANTLFAAGTGLQTFLTKWDSTEWSGVTNTYYFQAEAANGSTSDVELWEADGGGSGLGVLTNIDNAQISSAVTMPTSQNMDTKATTNANDVAGARIIVAVVVDAAGGGGVVGPGHEYIIITSSFLLALMSKVTNFIFK